MKLLFAIVGVIGAAMLGGLLLSIPVMLLWNAVMPDVFGLTEITFE